MRNQIFATLWPVGAFLPLASGAPVAPVKSLPVGGVAATSKNIQNGDFPISRPLTLVTKGAPAGLVQNFIEYASSSQVTDPIVSHDFVPYPD